MTKTEYIKDEIDSMVSYLEQHPEMIPGINQHIRNSMSPEEQQNQDTQILIDSSIKKSLLLQKHPQLQSILFPNIEEAGTEKLKAGIEKLNIPEMVFSSDGDKSFSLDRQQ